MYRKQYPKCDRASTPSAASCTGRERRTTKQLEARLESYAYRRYLNGPRRWECPACDLRFPIGAGPRILPPMEIRVGANVVIGLCERCGPVDVDGALDDASRRVEIATLEANATPFRGD